MGLPTCRRKPARTSKSLASSRSLLTSESIPIGFLHDVPFSPSTGFLEIPPVGIQIFDTRLLPSTYIESVLTVKQIQSIVWKRVRGYCIAGRAGSALAAARLCALIEAVS